MFSLLTPFLTLLARLRLAVRRSEKRRDILPKQIACLCLSPKLACEQPGNPTLGKAGAIEDESDDEQNNKGAGEQRTNERAIDIYGPLSFTALNLTPAGRFPRSHPLSSAPRSPPSPVCRGGETRWRPPPGAGARASPGMKETQNTSDIAILSACDKKSDIVNVFCQSSIRFSCWTLHMAVWQLSDIVTILPRSRGSHNIQYLLY